VLGQACAIALGGALGALARFWLSNAVYALAGRAFPWGTLAVNVAGSLVMGVLFVTMLERAGDVSTQMRAGLMTGFLGALTTFSTFSLESVALLESGRVLLAGANAVVSVVTCIAACWAGMWLARAFT
jgi:fluoride exporter